MAYEITTTINEEKCTGCGLCVTVCPYNSLGLKNGKAVVTGKLSMHCGQCVAVCKHDAIAVDDLVTPVPLTIDDNPDAKKLFDIISMRRSCRHYKKTPVEQAVLEDLVTFGVWAPSGTNSQKWAFTIVPDRKSVIGFAGLIAGFYKNLNRQAANPLLRIFTKIFMGDVLGKYYKRYYKQIKEGLEKWDEEQDDILFHDATAAIIVSVDTRASCAKADAIHAAQNIILGAHAMNLGSCLIGFAVKAMNQDHSIAPKIGIPDNHEVYSVIAIGHPKLHYPHPSGRKPVESRYYKL